MEWGDLFHAVCTVEAVQAPVRGFLEPCGRTSHN